VVIAVLTKRLLQDGKESLKMITQIEDYFSLGCGRCDRFATADCSTQIWANGLVPLRKIILEQQLLETAKWGHPVYMHHNRNIAIIGALRGDFRLSFFNAALMKDPQGVLERQGPNTKYPDMLRFKNSSQVIAMQDTIRAYLQEAMSYAEAGIKPPKVVSQLEMPDELLEALDADPELAEAFHSLTPGRQKSYAFNLNSAKKSETRVARIIAFRDKILAGKGALER
jgi:uncharacterized protein YdeI (YjbR/CyaY-like superfamily)